MFTAYGDAFYFTQGTNGYFRANTEGGKTWFWERAEQMEMLLDVYEQTGNRVALTMFSNVFNGFITDHGRSWAGNEFNDDIMWMVIACARGFQHTGNPAFRDLARANFDMCYARAWSTNLGGGLWWKTANLSKNACVNGPAAIAAHLLYQIYGDTNYLETAHRIYQWQRATLFNPETGGVYDSVGLNGQLDYRTLSYNQGTFIGAANFLGYTNDARLAADYTMNTISRGRLLPHYGENGDGSGFNGICVRWMARFMKEQGLTERYQAWLQHNAAAAWNVRRRSDNLAWSRWRLPTPEDTLYSWACSSAVVILHVVPPSETSGPEGVSDADFAGKGGVLASNSKRHALADSSVTRADTSGLLRAPAGESDADARHPDQFTWRGVATNVQGEALASVTVNFEDAPDLTAWAQRAGELCVEWYPKLVELLASDDFKPAREVRLSFRNDYGGVAATSRDRIDISANYVRSATNDFGMVIHELVHVVQAYHRGNNPGWLVEGVADYIRLVHFEPQARRPRINPDRASYRDAYKTTAIFLEWIERRHDPHLVRELNRAMREGRFQLELFKERTGKTVDELWDDFVTALRQIEK